MSSICVNINTNFGNRHVLPIYLAQNDAVSSIKAKISEMENVDAGKISLIFCGRVLSDHIEINSLNLGPTTSLTAVIESSQNLNAISEPFTYLSSGIDDEIEGIDDKIDYANFYVYCKNCSKYGKGKLRAYCNLCDSSAIVFLTEPEKWSDVLGSKLSIECNDCLKGNKAHICFKCTECNDVGAPLQHVKRNSASRECIICGNVTATCVDLGCSHISCVDCFTEYCLQIHNSMSFIFKHSVGYTISCPAYECDAFVSDVHHFYLLGIENYKKYQRTAAHLYFMQQSERQCCPCGAAFIVEDIDEKDKFVLCPECSKQFCRFCHMFYPCKCDEIHLSETTLQKTSKKCPGCQAPTERNGGCAHITCTQCRKEWCFVCMKLWTDDCQWEHWFG